MYALQLVLLGMKDHMKQKDKCPSLHKRSSWLHNFCLAIKHKQYDKYYTFSYFYKDAQLILSFK